jgi:Na+/melibiose symporter-like transporter
MEKATELVASSQVSEKLSIWHKIGYGVGDIYGGGTATILSF